MGAGGRASRGDLPAAALRPGPGQACCWPTCSPAPNRYLHGRSFAAVRRTTLTLLAKKQERDRRAAAQAAAQAEVEREVEEQRGARRGPAAGSEGLVCDGCCRPCMCCSLPARGGAHARGATQPRCCPTWACRGGGQRARRAAADRGGGGPAGPHAEPRRVPGRGSGAAGAAAASGARAGLAMPGQGGTGMEQAGCRGGRARGMRRTCARSASPAWSTRQPFAALTAGGGPGRHRR